MNIINQNRPVILVIAGHDPCGGAGIQADIESIIENHCYPVTVISSLTSQNTGKVMNTYPVDADIFMDQLQALLSDIEFNACKIGLLNHPEHIDIISNALDYRDIPIVLDPVIYAGSGSSLTNFKTVELILEKIFPITTLVTPNSIEARELAKTDNLETAADYLLSLGTKNVLITGAHEGTDKVINTLYQNSGEPVEFTCKRLTGTFHGSGCTLSSSITSQLALGETILTAVKAGLDYTWNTLNYAQSLGKSQLHPGRLILK